MASLTLKGIPDELLIRLRRAAETNEGRRLDPESLLARADALRARLALAPLDDAAIRQAKQAFPTLAVAIEQFAP